MAALFRGWEEAFAFFGGVPEELLFENMRAVITKDLRMLCSQLIINEEFLRLDTGSSLTIGDSGARTLQISPTQSGKPSSGFLGAAPGDRQRMDSHAHVTGIPRKFRSYPRRLYGEGAGSSSPLRSRYDHTFFPRLLNHKRGVLVRDSGRVHEPGNGDGREPRSPAAPALPVLEMQAASAPSEGYWLKRDDTEGGIGPWIDLTIRRSYDESRMPPSVRVDRRTRASAESTISPVRLSSAMQPLSPSFSSTNQAGVCAVLRLAGPLCGPQCPFHPSAPTDDQTFRGCRTTQDGLVR